MKERKWYCSLTPKDSNAYHRKGRRLKLTERTVNIGETADCDVRYEPLLYDDSTAQPHDYYATLLRSDDGQHYSLVCRSQQVDVSIDGRGSAGFACELKDGDIIRFDGQAMPLQFHIHHDDRYNEPDGQTGNLRLWMLSILLVLVGGAALLAHYTRQEPISEQDVEPLETSVFLLRVDSVQHVMQTDSTERLLHPTMVVAEGGPTGTAFLTDEGKLVTARHCVEFWVAANLDLTTRLKSLADDDVNRWAIETETFNQTHLGSDSTMLLRTFFSIYNFAGDYRETRCSTDSCVHINKERDGVLLLADFDQASYWRTIRPYFTARDMALGDFLWIDSVSGGEKGSISLATPDELQQLKNGTRLMVCGFPMTSLGDKRVTFTGGVVRQKSKRKDADSDPMLYFEANVNHGFSGGPVLMKTSSGRIVAAGIVSRVDSVSSGLYKWAVPVSELSTTQPSNPSTP